MTIPTPILVLKGPRVEDESKLKMCEIWSSRKYQDMECLHLPPIVIVWAFFIIEVAGIFDRDLISLVGFILTVPRFQQLLRDTHNVVPKSDDTSKEEKCLDEDFDRGFGGRARGLEEG